MSATGHSGDSPIAIVGIGCRFPGGINSPKTFWKVLKDQVDTISEVPAKRWGLQDFYSADPNQSGRAITRWGGFLSDIDKFDPQFFHISPREAIELDPQQRLLLEVCWEAFEHAGVVPTRLCGSQTGVFVGACSFDYFRLRIEYGLRDTFGGHVFTGGRPSLLAGRLAYAFDFKGPTLVVDTACSSSLVALHLASQSLQRYEVDYAVVGGVNALLDPSVFILASKLGTQSPGGRCKAFDAQADGFVRSEGCGILIVRRLDDALRDGNQVLAVVRGSGVNQDGNSASITAPDVQSQIQLMRAVLRQSGLQPEEISYVEAHGTGTPVGDPVEFESIAQVFGQAHGPTGIQLPVGSVKTNLGHCEAASGVASLIKVILSLQHKTIPANLHFNQLNPSIEADDSNILIPTAMTAWKTKTKTRIAAINSFGFSGTNAHVLLEEAVIEAPEESSQNLAQHQILCLSAKSSNALRDSVSQYHDYLTTSTEALGAICYTANVGRSHFRWRHCVIGSTSQQLQNRLSDFIEQTSHDQGKVSRSPKVAFIFTGQGSQYPQMGKQLFDANAVFRQAMITCDQLLAPHLGISLVDLLYAQGDDVAAEQQLQQTNIAQPAIFAVEYALYQVWRAWGIIPDVLLGHSVGEYVAACVSGLFSLEQGLALIAARGQLMQALPDNGGMLAVSAGLEEIGTHLGELSPTVSVAAINAPDQTVLSGESEAIHAVAQQLETKGLTVHLLPVSHAFHSALVEPMLESLRQALNMVEFHELQVPVISNVTGELIETAAISSPDYWLAHTRQRVNFKAAMKTLAREEITQVLEVGPCPTLVKLGQRCLPDHRVAWLSSMGPDADDGKVMLESLAKLYVAGCEPDFRRYYRGKLSNGQHQAYGLVELPTYPFQRKRYWSEYIGPAQVLERSGETTPRAENVSQGVTALAHPLLGKYYYIDVDARFCFDVILDRPTAFFLNDHKVGDVAIFPGAGYIELALVAGQTVLETCALAISNLHLRVPLPISSNPKQRIQLVLTRNHRAGLGFEVLSRQVVGDNRGRSICHASGEIYRQMRSHPHSSPLTNLQQRLTQRLAPQYYYQQLAQENLHYGPHFQCINDIWVSPTQTEVLGRLQLVPPLASGEDSYQLHPALLDGCSQLSRLVDASNNQGKPTKIPYFYEKIDIYGPVQDQAWCYACKSNVESVGQQDMAVDFHIYNPSHALVAKVSGLHRRASTLQSCSEPDSPVAYQTIWQQRSLASGQTFANRSTRAKKQLTGLTLLLLPPNSQTVVRTLAQPIIEASDAVVQVSLGERFECCSEQEYQIAWHQLDDWQQLLHVIDQQIEQAILPPIQRILHFGTIQPDWGIVSTALESQSLKNYIGEGCGSTLYLLQALAQRSVGTVCELWLITCGSQAMPEHPRPVHVSAVPLWGLGRVIRSEYIEFNCWQVDLDPWDMDGSAQALLTELSTPNGEEEVAYRAGQRWIPRLVKFDFEQQTTTNVQLAIPDADAIQLTIATRGLLDSLQLKPQERQPPGPGKVEVQVVAAGLNFRDVLNALGAYQGKQGPLGGEFAGKVVRVGDGVPPELVGKPVVGLGVASFSRYVVTSSQVVAELPESLSFEQGAAIPITFLTAYHTLYRIGQLKAGERVLIHAGTGGVGLAAIQLAQRVGAEVFATAGSDEKRALLRTLGVKHVMNSRKTDFADEIEAITEGEGIDLVLNSLTGEFITKGLSLLRTGGRFIELGKAEMLTAADLAQFDPTLHYIPYYLGDYRDQEPALLQSMLQELLTLFAQGELHVFCRAFPVAKAVEAFRLLQRGNHIGKLVLTFRQRQPLKNLDPQGTYLLTGGLGGIGLQVAQRLIERGVRHLVLLSRRGQAWLSQESEAASQISATIQRFKQQGAQVTVLQADVAVYDELLAAMDQIRQTLPPLRGIFHAAGALADGLLAGQDWSRFHSGIVAKVDGTCNLHRLTKNDAIDCFVLFSSVSAVLGPAARGSYAAANLFLDAIAHQRTQAGLPCLSINWGAWAETGMAKEIRPQRASWQNVKMLTPMEGLHWLDKLMHEDIHQIGIFPMDWQVFQKRFVGDRAPRYFEILINEAVRRPKENLSSQEHTIKKSGGPCPSSSSQTFKSSSAVKTDMDRILPQKPTINHPAFNQKNTPQLLGEQRIQKLEKQLLGGISELLRLDSADELELDQPLELYGLDSLMTVELRNWLFEEFQVELPMVQLNKHLSIVNLAQLLQSNLSQNNSQTLNPSSHDGAILHRPIKNDVPNWTSSNLQAYLAEGLSKLLQLDSVDDIELDQPLELYGLDSLMTVELRNWLFEVFQVELPMVKLNKRLSILALAQILQEDMAEQLTKPVNQSRVAINHTSLEPPQYSESINVETLAYDKFETLSSDSVTPSSTTKHVLPTSMQSESLEYSLAIKLRNFVYSDNDHELTVLERFAKQAICRIGGITHLRYLSAQQISNCDLIMKSCLPGFNLKFDFNGAGLDNIPKIGPHVVVANHPLGVIDGAIIRYLVSLRRSDFKIITSDQDYEKQHPELAKHCLSISVAAHLSGTLNEQDLASLTAAISHVKEGGALILFPSGLPSVSHYPFGGRAVDPVWQPFLGKIISDAKASVTPIYFAGQTSRLFQLLYRYTGTVVARALLAREQFSFKGSTVQFHIGPFIPYSNLKIFADYHEMTRYLRFVTYDLKREIKS